ncbi:MAG: MAPEG family protein [Alphaproteobacteria bacterium]|nr:MAPEG family protein [Alphaproteobacteria bacterium]
MSGELWCLVIAILIGFVSVGAQSFTFKAQVGHRYTIGPRDEGLTPERVAGRMERALRNFTETFAFFAAAVLMVEITRCNGLLSLSGSVLYVVSRALYLPAYAFAPPGVRTLSWQVSMIGILLILAQLAFP